MKPSSSTPFDVSSFTLPDADHPFFALSPPDQKVQIWKIAGITLLINLLLLGLFIVLGLYWVPGLVFFLSLQLLAPFVDVPTLKRQGKLQYFSPFLLAEAEKAGQVVLHGGTLFDYYYGLDFQRPGRERTQTILHQMLSGLQQLIRAYESHTDETIRFRGTSYILNPRTAQKLGFQKVSLDIGQQLILMFNYVPLLVAQSLAKGSVTFPRLGNIHTYEAQLSDLLPQQDFIAALTSRLERLQ